MKLIVNNAGRREIINLNQIVKIVEFDENQMPNTTPKLFPYRIMIHHINGTDEILYQTDEKFECSTVMAGIVGAMEEGKATHTIDNRNSGLNANAIVKRARENYDGTNYIGTIKLVREMTGWGLREAKSFCDDHVKCPIKEDRARKAREAEQAQRDAYRQQQQQAQEPDSWRETRQKQRAFAQWGEVNAGGDE
jgi:ribosomal protein L7/L12